MAEQFIYSPETIIKAYSCGVFPMAQSRDDPELRFYEPAIRGVIPIDPPKIPRRLVRFIKHSAWHVTFDRAFGHVVHHCAEMRRDNTWINAEIERLYFALHKMGFGHSVEIWEEDRLIGGLYGLSLGSAFFGESMFSKTSNASKMALACLMAALHHAKFTLLDAQFSSEHLRQFGLIDIPQPAFKQALASALSQPATMPLHLSQHDILAHLLQLRSVTS